MPRGARYAIAFLSILFVLANGYSGAVLYTFTKGTPAAARIEDCNTFVWGDCTADLTLPDGTTDHGAVTGSSLRPGETVDVVTGPIGAYAGGLGEHWPRLIYAAVVDGVLLVMAVFIPLQLSRTKARRRRFEAEIRPDHTVWGVDKDGVTDRNGSPLWLVGRERGRLAALLSPGGTPAYRAALDDSPPGARLALTRADGAPVGRAMTIHANPGRITIAICDPAGNQHARLVNTGAWTMVWELTAPDGSSLGTAFLGPRRRLVRFEPRTPEQVRLLVAAYLVEANRMNSAAATVGTAIG